MSRMEAFYGVFEKSDLPIEPEDTDDFFDLEKQHKKRFVKVEGQLYAFWSLEYVDVGDGFELILKPVPEGQTAFIAYWYNGGAGIHEVVEDIIQRSLTSEEEAKIEISDDQYRAAARINNLPDVSFDQDAVVSRGDPNGAYVQAWVWVPNDSAREA